MFTPHVQECLDLFVLLPLPGHTRLVSVHHRPLGSPVVARPRQQDPVEADAAKCIIVREDVIQACGLRRDRRNEHVACWRGSKV